MKYTARFVLFLFVCALHIPLYLWGGVELDRLGDIPGGSFLSEATDVSNDGRTVVGRSVSSFKIATQMMEAFRWEVGDYELTALGDLTPPEILSHTWSSAYGISGDGRTIVGFAAIWDTNDLEHTLWAFQKYREENLYKIGPFNETHDEFEGLADSQAFDISDDGELICGQVQTDMFGFEAFLWDGSQFTQFAGTGSYAHYTFGIGYAVTQSPVEVDENTNVDGAIVVGKAYDTSYLSRPVFWLVAPNSVNMHIITSWEGEARGVSTDGEHIVGHIQGYDGYVPFYFDRFSNPRKVKYLPILEGDMFTLPQGIAHDITADANSIVGWTTGRAREEQTEGQGSEAVIWRRIEESDEFTVESLNDIADNAGIDREGFFMTEALAITENGEVIVGSGYSMEYGQEAFRLRIAGSGSGLYHNPFGGVVDDHGNTPNSPLGPANIIHFPNVYSHGLGGYAWCAEPTISEQGAWFFLYDADSSD